MLHVSLVFLFLAASVGSFISNTNANRNQSMQQQQIQFTVSMPKPYTHLLEVEVHLRDPGGLAAATDLLMPVWTPGSYLVREYARNVQDFGANDSEGHPLTWSKVNKYTWRINTSGQQEIVVTYRVYCNEFSVRTNEVNDLHAFWNNAALLMYPQGQLKSPSTLRINPYGDWKIATGLPAVKEQPNTFHAENFDILYDSPFEVSDFRTIAFEVNGIPHRIVIDGEGNYDPDRVRTDVKKIVETEAAMMGEIPYHDYTFILHLRATAGGGLEHLNSTSLGFPKFGFLPEASYKGFLSLVAHEFFHLWNVKRIRPDALGPFDYAQENYTRNLWIAEGITDYYAGLHVRRAGLISEKEYLADVARRIHDVHTKPGRLEMSAEDASFDAWIKLYRPDENSANSQISYYDKGALLGMLLDLEIRKRSAGAKSLDDVMRYLYSEFYKKNRNYTPEDFQQAAEKMAGSSLADFFEHFVRGRAELDFNTSLGAAGLRLETIKGNGANGKVAPYLGVETAMEGDRLMIKTVYNGTPAYDQGLNANDQIVAVDGNRVNRESFDARIAERKPGDTIKLTLFRFDELRSFDIKLSGHAIEDYRIVEVENPSETQKRTYQQWLGIAH